MTVDRSGDDPLVRATELLRVHTDAGWTAISAEILHRALRAFRPPAPVRGRHDLGDFFVAADVVVARLRQAVDTIPGAATTRITCNTENDERLNAVTIEILAAYGEHLLTLAGEVRGIATQALAALLGQLAPSDAMIRTHVHIGDVTDDPREVR